MAVMDADSGSDDERRRSAIMSTRQYDPERKLIFNSNGEGTVWVVRQENPDKYSVVDTVRTAPRAKTTALDPTTHELFLSTGENGQFKVLVVGQ